MTTEQITAYTGIGTMIGLIVVGFLAQINAYKASRTADKIHTLVNSQMGFQLRVNMLQAKNIAELTTDPEAKKLALQVAIESERLYNEHQIKQAIVDSESKS